MPTTGKTPSGLAALGERNYRLYWFGHFVSQSGSWIENTAVSWILYDLTGSPVLLGINGLFRAVPLLLLTLAGGAVADRRSRRGLLFVTESTMLAASGAVGLLAMVGRLEFWHLYVLSVLSGTTAAFQVPARQALFPGLVERRHMHSAVMLNATAVRLAAFVGPSLAGLLLTRGYAAPFLLNAASYLAMLAALAAMRVPDAPVPVGGRVAGGGMGEGVRFLLADAALRSVIGLEAIYSLFGHNTAILTLVARDVLRSGPEGLAWLVSATGAGALLGMLGLVVVPVQRRGRVLLATGSLYGALWLAFGLSRSLALSVALVLALGVADGVWSVTRNTIAQLAVPDSLRGRVMAVVILVTRGLTPAGQAQTGALAQLAGPAAVPIIGGLVIGGAVAAVTARVPRLRRLGDGRAVEPAPGGRAARSGKGHT